MKSYTINKKKKITTNSEAVRDFHIRVKCFAQSNTRLDKVFPRHIFQEDPFFLLDNKKSINIKYIWIVPCAM